MASNKFSKDSVEWKVFMDVWAFAQEFAVPENTDDYWNAIISKTKTLEWKYKDFDDALVREMLMAWMNHFERMQKGE